MKKTIVYIVMTCILALSLCGCGADMPADTGIDNTVPTAMPTATAKVTPIITPDVTDGAATDTDGIIGDTAASPSAAVTDNAANTASPEIGTDTTAAPKK